MTQELWFTFTGLVVPKSSIAATTDDVLAHVELLNGLVACQVIKKGEKLSSLDFAALYPTVMHSDLLEKLQRVLHLCFAYALGTNNSSSETAATNVYLKVEPIRRKNQQRLYSLKVLMTASHFILKSAMFTSCWSFLSTTPAPAKLGQTARGFEDIHNLLEAIH